MSERVSTAAGLRAELLAADNYGLLLGLLVADYVILSVAIPGAWALLVTTGSVALTALLAFHTSLVRGGILAPYRSLWPWPCSAPSV